MATVRTLRRRDQLVRMLRHFPNGSVNVFDRDLRYLFAAGEGLGQVGLSPEGLTGRSLAELFPKEAVEFVTPYYWRAFAGEHVEFELAFADHVYAISAAPLPPDEGGVIDAIIAVAQDVTDRKRPTANVQLGEYVEALGRSFAFERLDPDEARLAYPALWQTAAATLSDLSDADLATVVSLAADTCQVCQSQNSSCRCSELV